MARKLLLVDDDRDLVSGLKLFLESKVFEVATAESTNAAFAVLNGTFRPDAMVIDVMMEGTNDGIVFARDLRKHVVGKSMPVVMLTGMRQHIGAFPFKDDPRDASFLPVDAFLEKPIKRDLLLAKIEEVLAAKSTL